MPESNPVTPTGEVLYVIPPLPSRPLPPAPQHFAAPRCTAQVCAPPAAIAVTPELSPTTSVGTRRLVSSPLPSLPEELLPQHIAAPAVVTAQVWAFEFPMYPLVLMLATPEVSPTTSTGVALCVAVPSPSWPEAFRPQHLAPPALVTAQVWKGPAEICLTPDVSPTTSTGMRLEVVKPFPSFPSAPSPQHFTPPAGVMTQVCVAPTAICTTSSAWPLTLMV